MPHATIEALISDERRVAAVAAAAGAAMDSVGHVAIEPFPCELTSMTTEDLARVRLGPDASAASVVLKVARSPRHSPQWAQIPPAMHDQAAAELPWRVEPDLYRSPLARLLPSTFRMPAIYDIVELDDDRIAIWLEDVREVSRPWNNDDYRAAARGVGRLAGRLPESAIPSDIPVNVRTLRGYFFGRVLHGVVPALRSDEVWSHPLVADVADHRLRADLEVLVSVAPRLLDRLDELPRTLAHGDACPQNLLRPADAPDTVVAIDWSFAGICPLGMDAGQLLAGHAESGELEPDELPRLLDDIVEAYLQGLNDEHAAVEDDDAVRGILGNLVVRSAFSALPLELLDAAPTTATAELFRRRAGYARFLVDLGLERFAP